MNYTYSILCLLFLFLIFFYFYYTKKQKEHFNQPKWEKTLQCLQFNKEDINKFKQDLLETKDSNKLFTNIVNIARKKGLDDKEVFNCLTN